jgi:hypothetical protein
MPEYSADLCGICFDPLLIPSGDDEGTSEIIDDVELRCGGSHHFHWECILSQARANGNSSICPLCRRSVLNTQGQFLVDIRNEGGMTAGFDMGELIVSLFPTRNNMPARSRRHIQAEELFMEAHPHERHLQTFFDLVDQGDVDDAEQVLVAHSLDINAFQPSQGVTALHVASEANDVAAVRMLLRHGANKTLKTRSGGYTALELAHAEGAQETVAILS